MRTLRRALTAGAALIAAVWLSATYAHAAGACDIDGVDRIVAIGDVHGAYDRLVEILRTTGLIDQRMRWSGGRAHLVQLGDVVDRGADSRKALDLLRRLEGEAARANGAVHVLLGNHEVMRMLGDVRYSAPGEYQAFRTPDSEEVRQNLAAKLKPEAREPFLKETPLGYIEMVVAFGPNGEYGKWLRTLNAIVKINGVMFLHGGLSPVVAAMPCDQINATVRRELTTDFDTIRTAPLESLVARETGPLWDRSLAQQPDTYAPQVAEILSKQRATAIVVAHTVSPTGRIAGRFGGKVIQIATGMQPAYVQTGRASALEIQKGVFTAIYIDRTDKLPSSP